jgi:predicted DsbA family dithiol-disulfide isomerase
MTDDSRIYNTFDAHRLLHWAGIAGGQVALKKALFEAYFTHGENPSDIEVLVMRRAGRARSAGGEGGDHRGPLCRRGPDGRGAMAQGRDQRRPSVIVNQRYLIQGGQPAEVFEQALRDIAAEGAAPSAG